MKKNRLTIWCDICEKWRSSHKYYKGKFIHERDDIPVGVLYYLNKDYIFPKFK